MCYSTIPNDTFSFLNQNLCVINHPDSLSLACDFIPNSINLGNHRSFGGLSNTPNYKLKAIEGSPCDTLTNVLPVKPENDYKVSIYPNPVKDVLTINYDLKGNEGAFILYNVFGQKVDICNLKHAGNQMQFSVSHLPKGTYLYSIEVDHISKWRGKISIVN